jgi:CheY-like chemotaxis protein
MTPILLIEDDPELARMTSHWLRRTFPDAAITHARNADEATQLVGDTSRAWQLVVSDYNLGPGGDGSDVLRFVQYAVPQLASRFVYFSASPEIRAWHTWIDKPSTYAEFKQKMQEVLGVPATITRSDADKLKRCVGCREDFYNGKNPYSIARCWSFAEAEPVTRWRLGALTQPIQPGAFLEVLTLSCHRGEGYVHYEKLPDFAIDPIRLKVPS